MHGSVITDIDALGAQGTTLLLVSCKSLIYSASYDAGDYQVVRNAASTIESAVLRWNEIANRLKKTPRGDNYDLSEYKDFVAVVCTPHPIYVGVGSATAETSPGLRAATCLEELVVWLEKK